MTVNAATLSEPVGHLGVERPRRIGTLAVLGDSTAVGLGDPVPGPAWRGFARLLADSVGTSGGMGFVNLARTGATVSSVGREQLPAALRGQPDVAVVIVGMNDTLRADFDRARIRTDLAIVAERFGDAGCVMLTVRYHDHTRLFRLPGPLRRALQLRIAHLNEAIDHVAALPNVECVDLASLYFEDADLWSVDRLHPSELGHRRLAGEFAAAAARAGFEVAEPVSEHCAGGVPQTRAMRARWMISEGIPWFARRGKDLLPYAVATMARGVAGAR